MRAHRLTLNTKETAMNTIKKINEIIENVETNADIEAAYRKSLFHWDIKNQEVSCVKGYVAHEIVSYYYSDETDEKINWMTIEKNERSITRN